MLSDLPKSHGQRVPQLGLIHSPDFQAMLVLPQSVFVGKTLCSKALRDVGLDSGSPPALFPAPPTPYHGVVQTTS